jgi:hypothetical protein
LISASFVNSEGQHVIVGYQNNRIDNVKVYEPGKIVCIKAPCLPGKLVREISYDYGKYPEVKFDYHLNVKGSYEYDLDYLYQPRTAHIIYHDGSQGDVVSRDVLFNGNRISQVIDRGKGGKMIAQNTFIQPSICLPKGGCVPGPLFILRTDASGNLLSFISFQFTKYGVVVHIILPSGKTTSTILKPGSTLEDVLYLVRKHEFFKDTVGYRKHPYKYPSQDFKHEFKKKVANQNTRSEMEMLIKQFRGVNHQTQKNNFETVITGVLS